MPERSVTRLRYYSAHATGRRVWWRRLARRLSPVVYKLIAPRVEVVAAEAQPARREIVAEEA